MVDSNHSTTVPGARNVYLSNGSKYYIADKPKSEADSRIPFPTPGLIAMIEASEGGFVDPVDAADTVGTFGNSDPTLYPGYQKPDQVAEEPEKDEVVAPEGQKTESLPPTSPVVSDEPTSQSAIAPTNTGTATKYAVTEIPAIETATSDQDLHPDTAAKLDEMKPASTTN